MEIITIDGMVEHDFRHSIEDMLRLDQVDEAIARLRDLVATCCGPHEVLPPRFLEVTSADIEIGGWHRLADRVLDHDRPGHPISAIGVTLADARALGGPGPSRGRLAPFIKTFYFSDDAYPFSDATRDDLLDGYSRDGFEWQGDYQATDATLSIKGIDDLYGAIVELEDRLLARPNPSAEEIGAGTIGACYLAALIHQALRETIRKKGLPRPLCLLAACDGVYPFFDAPVAGSDECTVEEPVAVPPRESGSSESDDLGMADDDEPGEDIPAEGSLLTLVSRKGTKAPVMVLGEEDAMESARYSEMAGAQRLGIDDAQVLEELLEGIGVAEFADGAAVGEDEMWGEPGVSADVEDFRPAVASSGDAHDEPGPHDDAAEHDRSASAVCHYPDFAEVFPERLEDDALTADADVAEPQFAPPASHSLRARIKLAEPDRRNTFADRKSGFVDWLRRLVFRR